MAPILCVDSLEKHYEGFDLGPLDLTVEDGCVTGLIGRNGSGKTTTIKALLGLVGPSAGTIELFGERVGRDGPPASVKQRIGIVFDTVAFPRDVRVRDVGDMGGSVYANWDPRQFETTVASYGLPENKLVKELSRGMGMKLSLAFAMCHKADLLILDEPTAGMDPMARGEVLDMLRDFMSDGGRGILISSHITTDLEKIADTVTCIDNGKVVFEAPKDDICFTAGVARLRPAELACVEESGFFDAGTLKVVRESYGADVLVHDRRAFAERFPEYAVESVSIERYMELMLKGETR